MFAEMPALRACLIDLDDTLTDRARSIDRLVPVFIDRFGDDLDDEPADEIRRRILAGDDNGYASREELCTHLQSSMRWRRVPSAEQLISFWRERFPRCNVERRGATKTLLELHHRGLKLGVISNGMTSSQHTKLDVLGFRPLLSVVLISEEVGIRKPDPRIFQMALDNLGLLASEAIFVGDNPVLDAAGARALGMRGIWLNCRGDQPPKTVPHLESITSLDQLLGLCGKSES
jgi:putative hydrolase of the HAD superfamily